MYNKKLLINSIFILSSFILFAQELNELQVQIREMSKETDPIKSIAIRDQIIKDFKLERVKDAETFDMLNGNIALAFAMKGNYTEIDKYIDQIQNKFNQTSILSMLANQLVEYEGDLNYANKMAEETIARFHSFKDDPSARPESYTKENWQRFMDFAQYPYYDTYAKTLYALKRYDEALLYQRQAFDSSPEEGMPSSVERYAKLLELNGDNAGAKEFLLQVAAKGKLNKTMIMQLESMYIKEHGNKEDFENYLENLQQGVQTSIVEELSKKMLDETAPPFTLKDISGKQVSLSDYKGKIVILDLWATWCAPFIASFPAMQQLVNKHQDVVFLFIAVEEKGTNVLDRVKKFIERKEFTFKVLLDEPVSPNSDKHVIISSYRPNGIPAKYFIDKTGKLRFKSEGFSTDTELINEIEAKISIMNKL